MEGIGVSEGLDIGKAKPRRQLCLVRIADCSLEQKKRILTLRNSPPILSTMYTKDQISLAAHLNWASGLDADKSQVALAVIDEQGVPVGVLGIKNLDLDNQTADWGYYVDPAERGGLGAALEFCALDYVFQDLELEKLNCEVLEDNLAVVRLHKKFGFVEEGFRRSSIMRGEGRLGVFLLGLEKSEWVALRGKVYQKYKTLLDRFCIKMIEPN